MSTDSKHPRELRKKYHNLDGRRSTGPKSFASAAAINDAGSKRHGETQSVTKPGTEIESTGKSEQKPAKQRQENKTPSTTSEEHHHQHEHERPHDPQPCTTESAPKKSLPGDPAQHLRRDSRESPRGSNSQTVAPLPVGAAPAECFDGGTRQELSTVVTTTPTPGRSSKASNKTPDDAPAATISVPEPPEVTAGVVVEQTAVTAAAEVRPRALPEVHQGAEPRTHSDSDATPTNAAVQDAGVAPGNVSGHSGVLGGIANALGMRPPTAKEIRLEKDNHRLKEEVKFLRTEVHNVVMTARKYHHDAGRFHHENQRLQETIEAMSLEIKNVTKRYEEAKLLSETRGKELLGAQVFLTKADGLSISELIQKVDGLNDEIYQAAASLGESIIQKKVEPSEQTHCSPEETTQAKAILGSPLSKVLRTRAKKTEEGINPLLVQITLQTFFSAFLINRIRCWVHINLDLDGVLEQIYQKIWSSSDQAVSGRWRSLTRAQLKPDTSGWIKELTEDLDAILALASWEIGSAEDKRTLEARLPAIFKVVLDVREAIGEKFTSADIEVSHVESHTPFNNAYMEETYAADSEGHEKDPEIVVATVGMGVRKVVSLPDGLGYEYVLNPKVVLESSLKAVLEPPPPRPSRSKTTRRKSES